MEREEKFLPEKQVSGRDNRVRGISRQSLRLVHNEERHGVGCEDGGGHSRVEEGHAGEETEGQREGGRRAESAQLWFYSRYYTTFLIR